LELHQTHERMEQAEQAHHHAKKRAALLIIVLAVALAIIEMASKEAQFTSIALNIQSSDLYAFYQAKTIRYHVLHAAVEGAEALAVDASHLSPGQKQIAIWKSEMERLDSEPSTRQGRKELLERAKAIEAERDAEAHSYHQFEYGAASLQLAIVLASAAVITEVALLELISGGFGLVGVGLALLGWLAPTLLRL
jgi:uncharacterized protein DUF4337